MPSDYPEPPSLQLGGPQSNAPPIGGQPGYNMSHTAEASAEPEDIKRPRACEPCRHLKVRCDPDPNHPDGSCKRCAKAQRTCITTAPTRKRQKKTDSRVTELERKIDALTATLQASHNKPFMGPPQRPRPSLHEENPTTGVKRNHDGFLVSQYPRANSPSAQQLPKPSEPVHWRGPFSGEVAPHNESSNTFSDVIDKGIVDLEIAKAAFDRYVTRMAPEMPFVVFSPETTMGDIRRDKPALFLAILASAIGPFQKDVQMSLLNEAYQTIADRVVVKGEKCLELAQALMVCSIWYMPPDKLEELKFYQLVHLAVILCMDLGLNRYASTEPRPFMKLREQLIKKPPGDMKGPEARRTWLGCYFMSVQVSTALRRPQLLRWSAYMDECVDILQKHPDSLPSDHHAVWWVKLAFIMEDASMQLLADDTATLASFSDSKVRYTIRGFSNQLTQWRKDIPDDVYSDVLAHTFHVLNLFVHETAMSIDCKSNSIVKSPSGEKLPTAAIAPLIDALTTCISSIHRAFDIIMNVDPDRLTCLPTVALARTSYPFVSLIKIYYLLTSPESRIGQVIDMESLKLEYYLDHVTNHYRNAASLDGGRAAAKFGNIITMLRTWFMKKKDNGPALREIFVAETNTEPTNSKNPMGASTTPLELLSIVASSGQTSKEPSETNSQRQNQTVYTPSSLTPGLPPTPTPNPPTRLDPLNHTPRPDSNWSTPTSFCPSIPVQHPSISSTSTRTAIEDPNRSFYQSYSQPYTSSTQSSTATFPDMPLNMSMTPGVNMTGNEIGFDPALDPNNFFALETLMDEGLFTIPFSFDERFQF